MQVFAHSVCAPRRSSFYKFSRLFSLFFFSTLVWRECLGDGRVQFEKSESEADVFFMRDESVARMLCLNVDFMQGVFLL